MYIVFGDLMQLKLYQRNDNHSNKTYRSFAFHHKNESPVIIALQQRITISMAAKSNTVFQTKHMKNIPNPNNTVSALHNLINMKLHLSVIQTFFFKMMQLDMSSANGAILLKSRWFKA